MSDEYFTSTHHFGSSFVPRHVQFFWGSMPTYRVYLDVGDRVLLCTSAGGDLVDLEATYLDEACREIKRMMTKQ